MSNQTVSQTTSDRQSGRASGGSSRRRPVGASTRAVAALAGMSFALGVGVGGLSYHFVFEHHATAPAAQAPGERAAAVTWKSDQVDQWTRTLGLDEQQRARLDEAFDGVWGEYRALFAELVPRRQVIDAELRAKVKSFLDAKQKKRYEQAVTEADRKRRTYFGVADASAAENPIEKASGAEPQK